MQNIRSKEKYIIIDVNKIQYENDQHPAYLIHTLLDAWHDCHGGRSTPLAGRVSTSGTNELFSRGTTRRNDAPALGHPEHYPRHE